MDSPVRARPLPHYSRPLEGSFFTRTIMNKQFSLAMLVVALFAGSAIAGGGKFYTDSNRGARWHNANTVWHGAYSHNAWKQPMALIAPPNAGWQSSWSWGVGRTRMLPIYHQFTRPYVAPGGGGMSSPAPNFPPSTDHQGVYYIRGPW